MKWIVKDNAELAALETAEFIADFIRKNPDALLSLAAGHTSIPVFGLLKKMCESGELDMSCCYFLSMDEWLGWGREDDGSCAGFLYKHLFEPLKIAEDKIIVFDGKCGDPSAECARYERVLERHGGIGLILLGIGMNGHLALNEPGVDFGLSVHVCDLSDTTKEVGQKYFSENTDIRAGITIGIKNILDSKSIILLADSKRKEKIIRRLYELEVTNELPATALKNIPDAVIVVDKDAAPKELCY